ncbi:MAG: acyl-CoA thioesterase [Clostridia bacterium]|jgi:acyl-CoA thioester hydrolase
MYTWDARVRAIYRDTDQMGVVYYGNYYAWFEVGRNEFIRSLGLSYKELEEQGIMLPVIESRCVYKTPARYDDLVIVRTGVSEMTGARISFVYEVIRERDGALLAQGSTVHAFTDAKTFKPVNLKKRCAEYYAKLVDCMKNGG